MTVVLDTRTVVSALVFSRDHCTWLRDTWKTGRVVPLLCAETAKELVRVLAYPKFKLSLDDQKALLEEIIPYCKAMKSLPDDTLVPCRDPHDQIFLRLAQAGSARFLVSDGDTLLSYAEPVSFSILSSAQLRRFLEKD